MIKYGAGMRRLMSDMVHSRVVYRPSANPNVHNHNLERRPEVQVDFSFKNSWGMGYEGHSKPVMLRNMNRLQGGKNEFMWLFGILGASVFIAAGRKMNEDGLRSQIVATNTYAKLACVSPSTWDA